MSFLILIDFIPGAFYICHSQLLAKPLPLNEDHPNLGGF
jgi:hypothetical protein